MPQLDKFTFFTQIFWLLLLISFFYFFLINFFLPNLSSLLKLRYKVLYGLKSELTNYNKSFIDVILFRQKLILDVFLANMNCLYHFNTMYSKYNNKFLSKSKKLVKLRRKVNKFKVRELLRIVFPNRKFAL